MQKVTWNKAEGSGMEEALSTKWIVTFGACSALIYLRNGFMVRVLLGSGVNSVFSKVLKLCFNQPRPSKAIEQGHESPGMPSSHAHMLMYLGVFLCLEIRDDSLGTIMQLGSLPEHVEHVSMVLLVVLALYGGFLRVRIGRHTWPQVIAGYISGAVGAIGWYRMEQYFKSDLDLFVETLNEKHPILTLVAMLLASAVVYFTLAVWYKRWWRKPARRAHNKEA